MPQSVLRNVYDWLIEYFTLTAPPTFPYLEDRERRDVIILVYVPFALTVLYKKYYYTPMTSLSDVDDILQLTTYEYSHFISCRGFEELGRCVK